MEDKIIGLDAATLETTFKHSCFPHPQAVGVMALGTRWLAFPGNQALPVNASYLLMESEQSLAEKSIEMAKNISSGIYYLGDLGIKKLANIINNSTNAGTSSGNNNGSSNNVVTGANVNASSSSSSSSSAMQNAISNNPSGNASGDSFADDSKAVNTIDTTYAGTVIVFDTRNLKILAQFRAHLQPISAMAFDTSGTLVREKKMLTKE